MFITFILVSGLILVEAQLREDGLLPVRRVLYEDLNQPVQYYRTARRRVDNPAYRFTHEDSNPEDYYPSQSKQEPVVPQQEHYPNHLAYRDYEQVVKNNNFARLKKKLQRQQQQQQEQQQQQYLKEVTPTTSTVVYQRPNQYLRFNNPSLHKQEPEEAQKQIVPQLRYILPGDLQQKLYQPQPQYQYEPQDAVKPKQPFNIVAYQNALLTQQKLAEAADAAVYSQVKAKVPKSRPVANLDYYTQQQPQAQALTLPQPQQQQQQQQQQEPAPVRYQKPLVDYKDEATYNIEPPYVPQRSVKSKRPVPTRPKPEYAPLKQQNPYYPQEYLNYRTAKVQKIKYQQQEQQEETTTEHYYPEEQQSDDYYRQQQQQQQQQQQPQQFQNTDEARVYPTRYQLRQQYSEESQQQPQYSPSDVVYQGRFAAVGRGAALSYRQQLRDSNVHLYNRNVERPTSYTFSE